MGAAGGSGTPAAVDPDDVTTPDDEDELGLMDTIHNMISKWYYILRYISILFMLVLLIYIGIKIAISSIADERAKYKRMLADWVVGFFIIFFIHYYMIIVLKINAFFLDVINDATIKVTNALLEANEMGLTDQGLYETIRTRAYELRLGIGTSGMIMYMVLVYYTVRFIIVYFKRFFSLIVLTIIAPIVGLSYAFTKVNTGKATILSKWAQEYAYNVLLQTIHALVYGIFVSTALALSTDSILGFVVALVMLNFMLKADKIFRKIFKFNGRILSGNADKSMAEDFAAMKAIRASTATVAGSAIAKDFASFAKRKVGGVTNAGLYAGLSAYKGILDSNDKKLEEKKERSEELERKPVLSAEEQKEKMKLDSKIAAMEGRRNRLSSYRRNNASRTEAGRKEIDKKTEKMISAEEKARGGPISNERKQEIRKEVENKLNNKIQKRTVEYNKRTGKYEVTNGIGKKLKADINAAVWGNNDIKNATKAMAKDTFKGLLGGAMIFASIPQIVASPKTGLALLAGGIKTSRGLYGKSNYKNTSTAPYRRKIRKAQKQAIKDHSQKIKKMKKQYRKQKYSFNRFCASSLDTMKAQIRMEQSANRIRRLNNPNIVVKAITLPLKLTGIKDAARNLQIHSYNIDAKKKERSEHIDLAFALEKKKSLTKDFMRRYERKVSTMEMGQREQLLDKSLNGIIFGHKLETGSIFTVDGHHIQFANNRLSSLDEDDLVTHAILNVAAQNGISSLEKMDLSNEGIQNQLIEAFAGFGLISNEGTLKGLLEKPDNLISMDDTKKIVSEFELSNVSDRDLEVIQSSVTIFLNQKALNSIEDLKVDEHYQDLQAQLDYDLKQEQKRQKDVAELFDSISQKVEEISKDEPEALWEKIVQITTVQYMTENNITNAEDLKKEEHVERLHEILFEKLEEPEKEPETEEEIIEQRINEVVRQIYVLPITNEEKTKKLEEEIFEIYKEYYKPEETEDSDTGGVLDDIFRERSALGGEKHGRTSLDIVEEELPDAVGDTLRDIASQDEVEEIRKNIRIAIEDLKRGNLDVSLRTKVRAIVKSNLVDSKELGTEKEAQLVQTIDSVIASNIEVQKLERWVKASQQKTEETMNSAPEIIREIQSKMQEKAGFIDGVISGVQNAEESDFAKTDKEEAVFALLSSVIIDSSGTADEKIGDLFDESLEPIDPSRNVDREIEELLDNSLEYIEVGRNQGGSEQSQRRLSLELEGLDSDSKDTVDEIKRKYQQIKDAKDSASGGTPQASTDDFEDVYSYSQDAIDDILAKAGASKDDEESKKAAADAFDSIYNYSKDAIDDINRRYKKEDEPKPVRDTDSAPTTDELEEKDAPKVDIEPTGIPSDNDVRTDADPAPTRTITTDEDAKSDLKTILDNILSMDSKRNVRRSEDYQELNQDLETASEFDMFSKTKEEFQDFAAENTGKGQDELIANLFAISQEDKVAAGLKIKPRSSEKIKFMEETSKRENSTYKNTGVSDIISLIKNKK